MFGKKKIQELEYRLSEANKDLDKAKSEIKDLEGRLATAESRSSDLEASLDEAQLKTKETEESLSQMESKASDLEALLSTQKSKNTDLEELLSTEKIRYSDLEGLLSNEKIKYSDLEKTLSDANYKIADLESGLSEMSAKNTDLEKQLAESELEEIKEQARATRIEFEGMRDLYTRKVKEFDDTLEEKEQAFAREDALQRYYLENEIRENKQENQVYVRDTVQKFSDSYNYYLNQIKLLMDALGEVAIQTGQNLFSEIDAGRDLKGLIGQNMAAKLQSETGSLRDDEDGMILIGNGKSLEEEEASEEGEAAAPAWE